MARLYEIIPDKLYTSGHPNSTPPVDVIVCLSKKPTDSEIRGQVKEWVYAPIPDSFTELDESVILNLVERVRRRLRRGGRVLLHCLAGRNRSSFVAALVYLKETGCSGEEAFQHLRKIRANCLYNPVFEKYLRSMV